MNADCSAGANPLAQLSKKAQQTSLQSGASPLSIQVRNAGPSVKSHPFSINEQNKQHLDQFMNIGGSSSDNRYMTPSLSRSISLPRSQKQTPLSPNTTLDLVNTKATASWSQEFYHHTGSTSLASPAVSTTSIDSSSPAIARPAYRPMGMMRPVLNMQRSYLPSQHQQKHVQQDGSVMNNEQWDQRFQELELEVQKSLSISEQVAEEVRETDDIMVDEDYQTKFQQIWEGLQDNHGDLDTRAELDQEWEADYQRFISGRALERMGYKFEEENQYMHNPDAYEIGCILMENGAKLSEAALAFEAAVQQKPQHGDAWFRLGLVQTQNEKELSGISALEQCLKVDPKNLEAMMTLAIGYINEGYDVSAFTMLSRWLEGKYPTLVEKIAVDGIDRYSLNKQVIEQYLKVINLLPDVDPDIQLGLGTLFYANDEFDKTIDCFRAALSVRPNDESMWNRLGASLANSNRSEEAIQAYHRAIQLKPTFVRARYNLAVSSMNIGCYKEAAENLLTALSMHEVEGVVNPNSVTSVPSSNILETLKRAFIAMDRRDLLEKVSSTMDLNQFRTEFTF